MLPPTRHGAPPPCLSAIERTPIGECLGTGAIAVDAPGALASAAVNSTKARLAAISMLDRAFSAVSDEELLRLVEALPEDHLTGLRHIVGVRAEGGSEPAPAEMLEAVRTAAVKGRINADLERIAVLVTDACLADCIEKLGDAADLPGREDLDAVVPDLVATHGVATVRLMLAAVVVGEAPASATIIDMLKNDDVVKLPPVQPRPIAPLLPPRHDDEERARLKAARKERKAAEQAAARARREQQARAKGR